MDTSSETATLAYIRHVIREAGISATALAKAAGIASTTLTRPLNNPKHKFNLSATTVEKIAKATGINPGPFFNNKDFASVSLASLHEKEAYDPEMWNHNPDGFNATVVIGKSGLGFWQDLGRTESFIGALFIVSNKYKAADCFAVNLIDGHAGEIALMGDYAFCIRLQAYEHEIVSGQAVLLERRRDGGRLIELTVRRAQKVKAGWQLNTPGRGRLDQDQVVIADLPGNDDAVVIGVVEYGVRQS